MKRFGSVRASLFSGRRFLEVSCGTFITSSPRWRRRRSPRCRGTATHQFGDSLCKARAPDLTVPTRAQRRDKRSADILQFLSEAEVAARRKYKVWRLADARTAESACRAALGARQRCTSHRHPAYLFAFGANKLQQGWFRHLLQTSASNEARGTAAPARRSRCSSASGMGRKGQTGSLAPWL